MKFVDTGVWFAAFVSEEAEHQKCRALTLNAKVKLVTTDYVLDELFTLMRMRGHYLAACKVSRMLLGESLASIHWVTPEDFETAWRVFESFRDKQWSFTDCTGYVVMQRYGVTEALALDDHFHQFGFAEVQP